MIVEYGNVKAYFILFSISSKPRYFVSRTRHNYYFIIQAQGEVKDTAGVLRE
jgi:hypothetical protein